MARTRVLGILLVATAIAAALGHQLPSSSSSPGPRPLTTGVSSDVRGNGHTQILGVAGGAVPDGTTVFDDGVAAVARLDPALLEALRDAAMDAAGEGISFVVESGWRSPDYQAQLLTDAIVKYGSREQAARWVASPNTSAHVSGDAVDLASKAAAWSSAHGAAYGLCRIYGNEPWHFEMRPEAIDHGCPPMYADPTQDPRMRR